MDLALEASALRGELPQRDYAGPVRGAKKATKYGLIGGGMGALAGGLLGAGIGHASGMDGGAGEGALRGGVLGGTLAGIPSAGLGALRGLLTDESQSDYLRRLARKDPGMIDKIQAPAQRQ